MTPSDNKGLRLPTTLRLPINLKLPMHRLFLRYLGFPTMDVRFPKQAMSCR